MVESARKSRCRPIGPRALNWKLRERKNEHGKAPQNRQKRARTDGWTASKPWSQKSTQNLTSNWIKLLWPLERKQKPRLENGCHSNETWLPPRHEPSKCGHSRHIAASRPPSAGE